MTLLIKLITLEHNKPIHGKPPTCQYLLPLNAMSQTVTLSADARARLGSLFLGASHNPDAAIFSLPSTVFGWELHEELLSAGLIEQKGGVYWLTAHAYACPSDLPIYL